MSLSMRFYADKVSLMLVTCLSRRLGYDKSGAVAKHAHKTGKTLRQAAVELNALTEEEYDELVRPELMLEPADKSTMQVASQ